MAAGRQLVKQPRLHRQHVGPGRREPTDLCVRDGRIDVNRHRVPTAGERDHLVRIDRVLRAAQHVSRLDVLEVEHRPPRLATPDELRTTCGGSAASAYPALSWSSTPASSSGSPARTVEGTGRSVRRSGRARRHRRRGSSSNGWVFTDGDGQPIHPHAVTPAFERIARRAGVPVIRLHELRHTHRTLLIKAGVPVKVVSERLGHAHVSFTIATYQHVLPGMQADAARVYEALARPVEPSPGEGRGNRRRRSA